MSYINLTKADRLFVEGCRKYFCPPPEDMSADDIKDFNNKELPKSSHKYLEKGKKKNLISTYVIPVSDGSNISAYYFAPGQNSGSLPLMIYCHGGGWTYGNMGFYSSWLSVLCEKMECAILLIDYRLSPLYPFPTAIEDCFDSVIWALQGVKYWKNDPDRVYIMGDGAGGTIAAAVSLLLRDRKGPQISGEILLYPLLDCRLRTQSTKEFSDTPVLTERDLIAFVKNYARNMKDSLSPLMSPLISTDLSRLPPSLIIGAEFDPLSDDTVLYAEALLNAGSRAKSFVLEGTMHGFMPFKTAKGRIEAERLIYQLISGRNVENISLMNNKEFKIFKKDH